MTGDFWIVIPRWEEFQHRDAARANVPTWIKTFTKLLSDDDYLDLSGHQRAILHGLWLEYARSTRRLKFDTRSLTHRLCLRVTSDDIESLSDAGWIQLHASRPASNPASTEEKRVEKNLGSSTTLVSEPRKVVDPTLSSQIRRIYDHWREQRHKTRSNYTTCSPARRKKIQARLREFTADELCTAIDHIAHDPWPDRSHHDDLTIIFRSREQVERFLEMPPPTNGNGNAHLSDYDRAKAWVLATGWRFNDADLLDQLGRFGIEGPAKQPLFDLAVKLKEDNHADAIQ